MKRAICSSILALAILAAVSPCSAGYLRARTPLKNRYIVQLKNVSSEQVEETSKRLSTMFGGRLLGSMRYAMKGFGVEMTEAQARVLAKNPLVDVVEDQLGFMSTGPQSERRERTGAPLRALAPQSIPTTCTWRSGYWDCPLTDGIQNWGLDRLSRLDLSSATRAYQFATTGQAGYPRTEQVRVYVIGTGIYATHDEFEGRVDPGHTMTTDPQLSNPVPAGSAEELPIPYDPTPANDPCVGWRSTVDDQMGHDTAVASVIGGRNTGVAKNAILVPVKVWTCAQPSQGPQMAMLGVARGIDWAIGDAQAHNARAVINMSLGFDNGFFNTNGFRTDQQLCESQSGPNYVLTPCAPALENEVCPASTRTVGWRQLETVG